MNQPLGQSELCSRCNDEVVRATHTLCHVLCQSFA